jgi:ring-1,2-phenylacetyl-CoA epoxidase subunit PaaD
MVAAVDPRTHSDSGAAGRLATLRAAVEAVPDPEIPVLTIGDLGIVQDVCLRGDTVEVKIIPTYSGCPAMSVIALEIQNALAAAGVDRIDVQLVHTPAWTTDFIGPEAREKLRRYGIAPPARASTSKRTLFAKDSVACPSCRSADTERVSEFGSTACKAHYRCRACAEPFDYFKCI